MKSRRNHQANIQILRKMMGHSFVIYFSIACLYSNQNSDTATLTIEPGVTVKFEPGTGLYIGYSNYGNAYYGALLAQGTVDEPITFTSNAASPQAGDWKGIYFRDQTDDAATLLEYCVVEYGGHTEGANVYLDHASPTIRTSLIRKSSGAGIYVYGYFGGSDTAVISGNQVEENNPGISLYYASPSVSGNTITGNTAGIYLYSGTPSLTGNTITNNGQSGIYLFGGTPSITGNTITNNSQSGIYGHNDPIRLEVLVFRLCIRT